MDRALAKEILEYQDYLGFRLKREKIRLEDNRPHDESLSLGVCQRFYGKEEELKEAIEGGNVILRRLLAEQRNGGGGLYRGYLYLFYALVGNLYYFKGDFKFATGYFMKVLDYEREDITAWIELLFSLRAMGEFELFEEGMFGLEKIYEGWKTSKEHEISQEWIKDYFGNKIKEVLGIIQVTRYCNQRCLFCSVPPFNKQPPIDEIKRRIFNIKKSGANNLMLSGGEPTVRSDLKEIIEFANKLNFRSITIQTNGVLLSDKELVEELFSANLSRAYVSFHSHIEEAYDEITSTKGNYKKALSALKNLNEVKNRLGINVTINTLNYKHLPELFKFLVTNYPNISYFSINYCDPIGNASENSFIVPKLSEVKPYLIESLSYLKSENKYFMTDFIPLCFLNGFEKHSTGYNTIKNKQEEMIHFFGDKTHNDTLQVGKTYPGTKKETCKSCIFNDDCEGLNTRYALLYGTDELDPVIKKESVSRIDDSKEAFIFLGPECNASCKFCYSDPNMRRLGTKEAKEEIRKYLQGGFGRISFTGGEPTIRKDMIELVKHSKESGAKIVKIQTNGILTSDYEYLSQLKQAGLDEIYLSIQSSNPDHHDYLVDVPGSLKRCESTLLNCEKLQLPVEIGFVITKVNYRDMYPFIEWIDSKYKIVTKIQFLLVCPSRNALENSLMIPSLKEIESELYQTLDYAKINKINVFTRGIPLCYLKDHEYCSVEYLSLSSNNPQMVESLSGKTEEKHSFEETNTKLDLCRKCNIYALCGGVWIGFSKFMDKLELRPR